MSGAPRLSTPIRGEVNAEGRLLRADDALRRLNQRAGGEQGGIFAIPPLLALAQLTLKLGMRLSRAVRVADESEILELWVEAETKGKLALLSIVSWRALPVLAGERVRQDAYGHTLEADASYLRFDTSARLVRATGFAAMGLSADDFGRTASLLLPDYFEEAEVVCKLVENIGVKVAALPRLLTRRIDSAQFLVSGMPLFDAHGGPSGYDCHLETMLSSENEPPVDSVKTSPVRLFGKHLAPVLRQPLGKIIANAETIGSELQGPIRENYALYARDIANAARHLSTLVDDLGDLEVVEQVDFKTAPDKIELGDVARRVAGLLALKAADRNIRILTPPPDKKVRATAEFRRVLQIMLNLVTNAIRYSPDGTEIIIDIEETDAEAFMSISDQGDGIAEENREKIFDKFERLGRSGDGGSGLGLYISRKIARAMGGDLTVEDTRGGGAQFTLGLPAG